MQENAVIAALGRRLRLAVIGGGPGSFIGAIHRAAARHDDRYEIVAAALSSNAERGAAAAAALGLPADRAYADGHALVAAERVRDDGADVIAIMTPTDSHYEYCVAALDQGFDIICDKPVANEVEEAVDLVKRVRKAGTVFCLTHNYTGYPLIRQARAMVERGMLGDIRMIQVEYVQSFRAALDENESDIANWRMDPARSGPSLVMGDIGTHAHHLIEYISRQHVVSIAADVGTVVPGRKVDDVAGALLRFGNGARGVFWATQAAAGVENSIEFRISGSHGSLEWNQQVPQILRFLPLEGPVQIHTPNGLSALPENARLCRVHRGHPEGFPEAFANLYADAGEAIACRLTGKTPDPLALWFPTVEDGARGAKFAVAAKTSSANNGAWTDCTLNL